MRSKWDTKCKVFSTVLGPPWTHTCWRCVWPEGHWIRRCAWDHLVLRKATGIEPTLVFYIPALSFMGSTEKWGRAEGAWTGDQMSISQTRARGELWPPPGPCWPLLQYSPSLLSGSSITSTCANLGARGGRQRAHNSVIALWILWGHITVCCANFYEYLFYNVSWNH